MSITGASRLSNKALQLTLFSAKEVIAIRADGAFPINRYSCSESLALQIRLH